MDLTPANINFLYQTLNFSYVQGYGQKKTYWQDVATEIPSLGEGNIYPFLSMIQGFREWVGPRVVNNVSARSYAVPNKHWELTLAVDANKIKDDQYGIYKPVFGMLGQQAAEWRDKELARVIEAATSVNGWDGQFFFDNDHPVDPDNSGSGTNSNLLVGATYDISAAAGPVAAYAAAKAKMALWKREDGTQMGTIPDTIMVHPNEEAFGKAVVAAGNTVVVYGSNTAAATPQNVFQGELKLIVNPYLTVTSGKPWYLLSTSQMVRPFIWQAREEPSLVARTAVNSDNVFYMRQFEWGVDLRGAATYSFPFLAFRMSAS